MGKTNLAPKSFYDPAKTYDDNFDNGPFTVFSDEKPHVDKGRPRFKFLGKNLYSPFGIAAGPLLNSNYVKYAFDYGFDAVCYKTQRTEPFKVNEFPNVLYVDIDGSLTLDKAAKPLVGQQTIDEHILKKFDPNISVSITNSFGNPSRGPNFWIPDTKKALNYQKDGQLLVSSVVGTIKDGFTDEDYFNDFAEAAKMAAGTGVEAIEINLSCPNVASEGILCYTHDAVVTICQKVKKQISNLPLIVKLGYFTKDQEKLLEQTVKDIEGYISALSVINTIPAPVVDKKGTQALPGPNRLVSGICGHAIKWAGIEMVERLYKMRKRYEYKFEIIGVGGVISAKDFHDYRNAGADLVQSATGAMWNPRLAAEIKATL